ncbi:MAG: hypothetical protein ACTSVV_16730 [Promethearchaeota archaeon]
MAENYFFDLIKDDFGRISIPKACHFSLGTSPYYAHQNALAIDIYYNLSLNESEVLSPVEGKVIESRIMSAPKAKFDGGIDREYLTIIESPENSNIVFKILHVKSNLKKGDYIEIGDFLGTTIRNGYFAYWSSPHLHLEIRNRHDAVRARGGKEFSINFGNFDSLNPNNSQNKEKEIIRGIVKESHPEFILAHLADDLYYRIGEILGVCCNLHNKARNTNLDCIVDGGIPIYKNGLILSHKKINCKDTCLVNFASCEIGTISGARNHFGFLKFNNVKFYVNDIEVRGISFFLAFFYPLIKIIPFEKDSLKFDSGSILKIKAAVN